MEDMVERKVAGITTVATEGRKAARREDTTEKATAREAGAIRTITTEKVVKGREDPGAVIITTIEDDDRRSVVQSSNQVIQFSSGQQFNPPSKITFRIICN